MKRDFWPKLIAANRAGERRGIASWCTAHPQTLSAILAAHRDGDAPILIEATCNQVNQEGGYTGMNPAAFRRFVEELSRGAGVDPARIIFGGDHLGPNPWKRLPAREAMARARDMMKAYVVAGYERIHIDASMACGDEATVSEQIIAERGAGLCAVAEAAGRGGERVYVIGTEVPIPGGETEALDALAVTPPQAARRTFDLHRRAFAALGIEAAMQRVVALVVQPGVDMGNSQVFGYDRVPAAALSAAVQDIPGLVYEAHSTDFQSETALGDLVDSHFAILKVGPSLTFAFREAVMAMARIAEIAGLPSSGLVEALEQAMDAHPQHWRGYIPPGPDERLMRLYGLSDRVRYYWPLPPVQAALGRLLSSLDAARIPPGIVSQAAGDMLLERGEPTLSGRVIAAKVGAVVDKYRRASGDFETL